MWYEKSLLIAVGLMFLSTNYKIVLEDDRKFAWDIRFVIIAVYIVWGFDFYNRVLELVLVRCFV